MFPVESELVPIFDTRPMLIGIVFVEPEWYQFMLEPRVHDFPVEHVVCLAVIVVVAEIQPVVEEAEIDAEIKLVYFLPFDVLIRDFVVLPSRTLRCFRRNCTHYLVADIRAGVEELRNAVVAEHTVAGAYLGIVEP